MSIVLETIGEFINTVHSLIKSQGCFIHSLYFSYSYVSGNILLGGYGESCDRVLDDCEAHLTCDIKTGKNSSARFGTCTIPQFVKTGRACDLDYLEDACEKGSYCSSDEHIVTRRSNRKVVNKHGSHSKIEVGSDNQKFRLGTKIGICKRKVGVGALCNSPFACVKDFVCTGPGGLEIGADLHSEGSVNGASGTVSWVFDLREGICY